MQIFIHRGKSKARDCGCGGSIDARPGEISKAFGSAAAAREYLVSLGFPPFKKGLTSGEFVGPNGRKARLSYGVMGKTNFGHSTGADWGYIVVVEG